MRYISLFLAILILCGCTSTVPESTSLPTEETVIPTTLETLPPATEPPDPLDLLLNSMSVEEKVGQLFLARCPGENAVEDVMQYHLGGYILFGQDFDGQTPDSIRETIAGYQNASCVPMLIAVDEEGGTVCRVSSNPQFRERRFPSPRELFASGGMDKVLEAEEEKAVLLHSLGINVNMAPVCDITTQTDAFMYKRSLGQDPETTGLFARKVSSIMAEHQVGSVLKHFPGYGNNADTHTGMAVDSRTLEELENHDLVPFAKGIAGGCDAVLMSHTVISALDETMPASLSVSVHSYLRNTLGFDGVIITDDLVMQAITDAFGAEEAAVLAVEAGNDLLCSTEYAVQYEAVLRAAKEGRLSMELIDSAVMRVLRWKQTLGLVFA